MKNVATYNCMIPSTLTHVSFLGLFKHEKTGHLRLDEVWKHQ